MSETIPFFDQVQQLYRTTEDVLASLRCTRYSYSEIPAGENPVATLLAQADLKSKFRTTNLDEAMITSVLGSYLERNNSANAIGLADPKDYRSADSVQEQISRFPHQVAIWNERVYNPQKQAIDEAASNLEERLTSATENVSRDVIDRQLYAHFDRGTFADIMTDSSLLSPPLITALAAQWKSKLYRRAQIGREDPGLLYELSFKAVAEQRGWTTLKKKSLRDALAAEDVPAEVYAHFIDCDMTIETPSPSATVSVAVPAPVQLPPSSSIDTVVATGQPAIPTPRAGRSYLPIFKKVLGWGSLGGVAYVVPALGLPIIAGEAVDRMVGLGRGGVGAAVAGFFAGLAIHIWNPTYDDTPVPTDDPNISVVLDSRYDSHLFPLITPDSHHIDGYLVHEEDNTCYFNVDGLDSGDNEFKEDSNGIKKNRQNIKKRFDLLIVESPEFVELGEETQKTLLSDYGEDKTKSAGKVKKEAVGKRCSADLQKYVTAHPEDIRDIIYEVGDK